MSPSELQTLILSQPDGSPIRVAYPIGDVECEQALARKTEPGYVPRRVLLSLITDYSLTWVLDDVVLHRIGPDGNPPSAQLFGLCSGLRWVLTSDADDLRTPIGRALVGCEMLAPFATDPATGGAVAANTLKYLVNAAEIKLTVVQVAFGFDTTATANDVAATRTI